MIKRIVTPLDGSDVAEQALAPAGELAGRLGIPVHLVRVVDLPGSDYTYVYGYMVDSKQMAEQMDKERELAQEYLDESARTLRAQGLTVTTELRNGPAASEITRCATDGDVVVMASHGRSGIARWYLGSVAEQVVRSASAPVMLVRAKSSSPKRGRTGAPLANAVA